MASDLHALLVHATVRIGCRSSAAWRARTASSSSATLLGVCADGRHGCTRGRCRHAARRVARISAPARAAPPASSMAPLARGRGVARPRAAAAPRRVCRPFALLFLPTGSATAGFCSPLCCSPGSSAAARGRLHGAEHRAIAAVEERRLWRPGAGRAADAASPPRCGTNFAALVLPVARSATALAAARRVLRRCSSRCSRSR